MEQWGSGLEETCDSDFLLAMESDLDTPRAVQRIRTVEKSSQLSDSDKRAIFIYADKILGLDLTRIESSRQISKRQQELLDARIIARNEKRWGDSDKFRQELELTGLKINDGVGGQKWKWR